MPGLFGFARTGAAREGLEPLGARLIHHADHTLLPLFADGTIASGLALRRDGYAGGQHTTARGIRVWIDGEAFGESELLNHTELAEYLASDEAPHPLNGNFTAVVYDPGRSVLRFITDPFGLKYLYVRMHPFPAWCGELQGFLQMPGPPPELNRECAAQILEYGHPLGATTWFHGVELLGPGLCATFDLRSRTWEKRRYYAFESGFDPASRKSRDAAAVALGRLIRHATERRAPAHHAKDPERIGITLSGGLDSRALLAAVPASQQPPSTVTFGIPGCADDRIAARAAAVRGSPHVLLPLGGEGWLEERAYRVPLTDGHVSILDLHGMESLPQIESLMDVCLHGFLGDALAGGSYLDRTNFSFHDQYLHRGRRYILQSLHYAGTRMIYRTPFLDLDLAQTVLTTPAAWLRNSRLYNEALLHEFPEYFRDIPWEKTGLPVNAPGWQVLLRRVLRRLKRSLPGIPANAGYTDYPQWLRREPEANYLKMQLGRNALVHAYVPEADTTRLLREHQLGADHSVALGRRLTLEIWLRHVREASPLKTRSA